MKPVLFAIHVICLVALAAGCGGNTPGQTPDSDSSDDTRVERDLSEDPETDLNDDADVATDDADDADAPDHTSNDLADDSTGDSVGTIIGPVDCESLSACTLGTTAWCEDDFWASCGLVDDNCEKIVEACGRGFTCASLTAECIDGRPGGDRCEGAVPISPGSFSLTNVSYRNRYDEYDGSCALTTDVLGPDRVFALSPPADATWTVTVQGQAQIDVVLALVSSCGNVISSCEQIGDEGHAGAGETVTARGGESGATWYLIVDGRGTFDFGSFALTVSDI